MIKKYLLGWEVGVLPLWCDFERGDQLGKQNQDNEKPSVTNLLQLQNSQRAHWKQSNWLLSSRA